MNKNIVVAIVLTALIIIAGVQAFQLFTIKEKLASGQLSTTTSTQTGGNSGSPKLPSSLENLPGMVGGC